MAKETAVQREAIEYLSAVLEGATGLSRLAQDAERERSGRRELCGLALAALAGAGYPTPEESYGEDAGWALRDLVRCVREQYEEAVQERDEAVARARSGVGSEADAVVKAAHALLDERFPATAVLEATVPLADRLKRAIMAATSAVGWRFPKIGDRVRCVAAAPEYKSHGLPDLEVGKDYAVAGPGSQCAPGKDWATDAEWAFSIEVNGVAWMYPVRCFEPVEKGFPQP